MPDFGQFFHDSYNALFAIILSLLGYLHIGQNKEIADIIETKVDKSFYKKDRQLLISETENKLDRIEFHLRLLCEKNGIHYQDKK